MGEHTFRFEIEEMSIFKETDMEVSIGDIDWLVEVNAGSSGVEKPKCLQVVVTCNDELHSNVWSCDASIRISLVKFNSKDSEENYSVDFEKRFNGRDNKLDVESFKQWDELIDPTNLFVVADKAVVEVTIIVQKSKGFMNIETETFSEPKENITDVCLIVEGKKVHVGKQILATHSSFFKALFYNDFKESSMSEITLEDVVHSEFVDLLNIVHPNRGEFSDGNIGYILKLADRFDMKFIMDKAEDFLNDSDSIHIVEKLLYAEKFSLPNLQSNCWDHLQTIKEIVKLTEHENYGELTDVTLSFLFQKTADLSD